MPDGVARPNPPVAWSMSPIVAPPWTRTVLAAGVVPATSYADRQVALAGEPDRCHHVGHVGAAGDRRWPTVDHPVVDRARLVILAVRRLDHRSAKRRLERVEHRRLCRCGHWFLPQSSASPFWRRSDQPLVRVRQACPQEPPPEATAVR